MGVETVLVVLLGVVTLWLVVDAGRERHRLPARIQRELAIRIPQGRHRPRELGQPVPADLRRRLHAKTWR